MATVTHLAICDGIRDTIGVAASIKRKQSMDEITESVPEGDTPLLMVYNQSWGADTGGDTHKSTFTGSVIQSSPIYVADIFVPKKGSIAESFGLLVQIADECDLLIEAEKIPTLFGVLDSASKPAIKSFSWTGERVTIEYAGTNYAGIRYTFTMSIF